ncbi:MAG: bifunctional adenosylcobinamide kinase/adenosylcobinamide-phosphate guanylyltransferase, partial [Myxococcota bacterium]
MVHHSTPPCAQIIVVVGGVRSGKSRFALQCAEGLGPRRGFIATAQAFDDEMTERITRHRQERDASYTTVEEPIELAQAL